MCMYSYTNLHTHICVCVNTQFSIGQVTQAVANSNKWLEQKKGSSVSIQVLKSLSQTAVFMRVSDRMVAPLISSNHFPMILPCQQQDQ